MAEIDANKFEKLVKWYLRFNGFFTIENFIIHAADDPNRIKKGVIGNYSEVDVIGVRMPYYSEITGEINIKTHHQLKLKAGKTEIIIGESKTGKNPKLNSIWSKGDLKAINYIINLIGIFETKEEISKVSNVLIKEFFFENEKFRIRVALFGIDQKLKEKEIGPFYMNYESIKEFYLERGACWNDLNKGIKSVHWQWDPLINDIFEVVNNITTCYDEKNNCINDLMKKK